MSVYGRVWVVCVILHYNDKDVLWWVCKKDRYYCSWILYSWTPSFNASHILFEWLWQLMSLPFYEQRLDEVALIGRISSPIFPAISLEGPFWYRASSRVSVSPMPYRYRIILRRVNQWTCGSFGFSSLSQLWSLLSWRITGAGHLLDSVASSASQKQPSGRINPVGQKDSSLHHPVRSAVLVCHLPCSRELRRSLCQAELLEAAKELAVWRRIVIPKLSSLGSNYQVGSLAAGTVSSALEELLKNHDWCLLIVPQGTRCRSLTGWCPFLFRGQRTRHGG